MFMFHKKRKKMPALTISAPKKGVLSPQFIKKTKMFLEEWTDSSQEIFTGQYDHLREWLNDAIKLYVKLPRNRKDISLSHLGQVLQNTQVTTISLALNEITDTEAKDFAIGLKGTQLTTVNLSLQIINDDSFVMGLKDPHGEFSKKPNTISTRAMTLFAEGLKDTQVTHLNLCYNEIKEDVAKALIKGLAGTRVTHLNLRGNKIGIKIIKDFAEYLGLTLDETLAFSERIGFIFGLQDLAESLKGAPVTTIDLSANEIEDEGAQALAAGLKSTQVTTLSLDGNEIRDEGAQALAEGLKSTQVTTLSLNHNKIGDKGAQALAEVLKSTQVTSLNLRNNYLSYQGIKKFTEKLNGTFLLKVNLNYDTTAFLSTLFKSNQDKLVLAPLYTAYLCYLKPEENKEYFHLPQLKKNATASEQLKFAGGILMKVCPELQDKILGFFPLMNAARKKWVLNLVKEKFFTLKEANKEDAEDMLCMALEKI